MVAGNRMVLGDGVSLLTADGRLVTIGGDDALVLLRWDDGVDQLVGRDSMSIRLIPGRWPHAERIRSHFESLVPGEAVIRMGFRGVPPDTGPVPERSRSGLVLAIGFALVAAVCLVLGAVANEPAALFLGLLLGGAAGLFHHLWYQNFTIPQVYDDLDWHLNHDSWRPDLPIGQAHLVGALKLSWLVDRRLLAPWVEESAAEHLDAYRDGQTTAIELYREMGGLLSSDLLQPKAATFFTWLDAPRGKNQRPADRWWKHMGFGAHSDPYATRFTDELQARSHNWFDRYARSFQILSLRKLHHGGSPTPTTTT